ncbi:MAG: rod shape determining protein RodA [Candidatus Magnetoglobus multicellularis str. Araruama]|uniref:Rod shape determining protein RodA n=1 Tax=Candidatus Magnetoglobus multicellularis str. Araruama TaxID=890399 RepID=A0A1V1NTU0_9BACT|nr:MAG: rod shape determining protein RodA [Candidatus Magnetoglobus multicellularis str. Araruama]
MVLSCDDTDSCSIHWKDTGEQSFGISRYSYQFCHAYFEYPDVSFFKGNEQGLGVFQPSELAKFLLIIVGALTGMHLSEIRIYDAEHLYKNPVKMIWPFVYTFIFVTSLAFFVFLSVRDMSPIIISCIFLTCCIWKIVPNPDQTKSRLFEWICRGGISVFCMIAMAFIIYIYNVPESLPPIIPQKDRILVWTNPALYPHSGEQVIKSMTIAGLGGWFGATGSWFGNNHAAMTVPMIQNDFVGAFIIYRWGGLLATLLLVIQICYMTAFFKTAQQIDSEECYGGFDRRRMKFVFCMMIYGFAWMTGIQWLISWSNVLGLFPVMGQPMTWISQANSHLIFFALPSLAFVMIARQGGMGVRL